MLTCMCVCMCFENFLKMEKLIEDDVPIFTRNLKKTKFGGFGHCVSKLFRVKSTCACESADMSSKYML